MNRFLGAAFAALLSTTALAQVNVVPSPGLAIENLRKQTYSAVAVGLATAASATDVACISASPSKEIHLKYIIISGTTGTNIVVPISILRRATLDTGGTPATGIALPVPAANWPTNGPASATLVSYTANPTITDTSPGYFRTVGMAMTVTTAAGSSEQEFEFGTFVEGFAQDLMLAKGSTQQVCVNFGATTVTTPSINITFEWSEQ